MKRFLYFILILISTLLLIEGGLRIMGEKKLRFSPEDDKIKCTPSPLFRVNDKFGYLYEPGLKAVTLNGTLTYSISINQEGFRGDVLSCDSICPTIAIFGCSFFGGMGVNDNEILSFQLQNLEKNYLVNNYAIPGHGMNLQYKKIQDLIETDNKPGVAVFQIASFHLARNVGAFYFLKNFANIQLSPTKYLTSSFSESDELVFQVKDVNENISSLDYYSVLYHFLKNKRYSNEFGDNYLLKLENKLIQESYLLCEENGIQALFMVITNDDISDSIVSNLESKHIPYLISTVDYTNDEYNLNPYDQHPNAEAHKRYALEIFNYLRHGRTDKFY
jgi:hypothetical protein